MRKQYKSSKIKNKKITKEKKIDGGSHTVSSERLLKPV